MLVALLTLNSVAVAIPIATNEGLVINSIVASQHNFCDGLWRRAWPRDLPLKPSTKLLL